VFGASAASFRACRSPKLAIWRTARSRKIYNTAAFSRDFMRPEADKEAIRTSELVGASGPALTSR
jgi:hypothetical protein